MSKNKEYNLNTHDELKKKLNKQLASSTLFMAIAIAWKCIVNCEKMPTIS